MKPTLFLGLGLLMANFLAPVASQAGPTGQMGGILNSLTLPGYDFQLMEISGQPVQLRMDAKVIGTAKAGSPLGFTASFSLANQTTVPRSFEFAAPYYANLRVGFRVLDADDNIVWQSYQILVDIPPLDQPVTLTLGKNATWNYSVFVPVYQQGAAVLGPGTYRLEAEILGSPAYSARSEFTVGVLAGGPLIPLTLREN
jgi:hypothetical protein